jgi:hypothetical protein
MKERGGETRGGEERSEEFVVVMRGSMFSTSSSLRTSLFP